jgi:hypothetical protein
MKIILLLFPCIFLLKPVEAQHNFVITGADVSNASGSASNSIGQMAYKSNSNASGLIIQGLQQPSEISGALPVTLLYFTATANPDKTVMLKWTTSSEFNSKHFEVERSSDAVNFQLVQTLPAAGNSTMNKNYTATDQHPLTGISYYRLRQTDLDGKYAFSQVEKIILNTNSTTISARPNPVTDHVMLYMQYDHAQKPNYQLVSLDGKIIKRERISANSTRIDMSNLTKGTYILSVIQGGKMIQTFKIMKQ